MSGRHRATYSVLESPPVSMAPISAAGEVAWPINSAAVLDDNEIVQFSIKPSLWFIVAVSYKVVLVAVLLCGLTWIAGQQSALGPWANSVMSFWMALGAARVAVAALQWASRLYVLTNRRVLSFRGVFHVRCAQCLLSAVSVVEKRESWCARWMPLGHLAIAPASEAMDVVRWDFVAPVDEVHDLVVQAIRRAQFGA